MSGYSTHYDTGESSFPSGGLPRELSENSTEYMIFVGLGNERKRQQPWLEKTRKSAIELAKSLTEDYIWQREDFSLELKCEDGLMYLGGTTDYGDAVEDEWLITYMLRELTISHPDVWVRISDSDGEFLLIEAANVLPKWLSPETDRHRAWIHQGKLLLIPSEKSNSAGAEPDALSLLDALAFVRNREAKLVHSPLVESEAFFRLEKYPAQIKNSLHHSLVTLPRKLAAAIHSVPKSVAPAVETFYTRDPIALQPLLAPLPTLTFPPEDLVTTSVCFSKVLFAQMRSQRFEAPPVWQKAIGGISGNQSTPEGRLASTRLEDGMKLTCGFEMLARAKNNLRSAQELGITVSDIEEDGTEALPTDQEMEKWPHARKDDDEGWMDIDFEEFERELDGKRSKGPKQGDFGDANTQTDIRKMVSRFEAFLNDEQAGVDGAQLDDMDFDDESSENSEFEDKDVSFDEEEFSKMMREMMGLPGTQNKGSATGEAIVSQVSQSAKELSDEDKEINAASAQMEAELRHHGALRLDEPDTRRPRLKTTIGGPIKKTGDEEYSDDEVDIDVNLAKNILESFKSQGGMAGPAGNLLGMMGLQLPRDEDDGTDNA